MNYRHVYHAGNFADVFKHITLIALTQAFLRKDNGFCYLDTHAGIGHYDLFCAEAQKSREFETGITKILSGIHPPPLVNTYLACVKKINASSVLRYYPGSPCIVREFLRPQDRMILSELHPDDCIKLKRIFANDKQTAIHCQDAYISVKALLPPKERRGFVLIDPPYEKTHELSELPILLSNLIPRWETGCYALWYPIKNRPAVERFKQNVKEKINRPLLIAELSIYSDNIEMGLNGCGMIIINPPWQMDMTLQEILPWLWQTLCINNQGQYHLELI